MRELLSEWKQTTRNITVILYYTLSFSLTVVFAMLGFARLLRGLTPAAVCYDALSLASLILFFYTGMRVRKGTDGTPIGKGYHVIIFGFIFGATALFFLDGGLYGGSLVFFLVGLILTPGFFRMQHSIGLMVLQTAAYLCNIVLSIVYPDAIDTEGYEMTDILLPFFFAALISGAFSLFYINAYHAQKRTLSVALDEARSANEAKAAFLDNMSHEIRTPMNTILGMNEMILREEQRPEIREYAGQIDTSGRALLSVINDILDYSKIQDNKMEITPIRYDLSSLINDMVNIGAEATKRKSLAFHVYADRDIPRILYGDEFHVRQVILNILNNAVKYTTSGGVTFRVGYDKLSAETIRLRVSIEDTGIGIREEDLEHIFVPFEHAGTARSMHSGGAGLGLSIVKNLLQLMGSDLEVSSDAGKGSVFSFGVEQRVLQWEPLGDYTDAYRKATAHAYERQSFTAPDARILVVDDTPVNLVVFRNLLKDTQIQIDTATSGQEMLQMAKGRHYDAIFLDHRMPGMDGIEAFHTLRSMTKNHENIDTPVIALTANAVMGARQMYLDEGFTDYLSKPVDSLRLERMLRTYLPKEYIKEGEAVSDRGSGTLSGSFTARAVNSAKPDSVPDPLSDTVDPPVEAPAPSPYASLTGIDYDAAVKNCGSEDTFVKALKVFRETLDEKAADIERFEQEGDIKNYTIAVHALKSAARLVGALQLSSDALHLEECGNREDVEEISSKTPALLQDFRAYKEYLSPVFPKEDAAEKPEMGAEDLEEFYEAVREAADEFDLDAIDELLQTAAEYTLPGAEQERFEALKKAVLAADWSEIEGILNLQNMV